MNLTGYDFGMAVTQACITINIIANSIDVFDDSTEMARLCCTMHGDFVRPGWKPLFHNVSIIANICSNY